MTRKYKHSPSAISCFKTCPRQFQEKYLNGNYRDYSSPAMQRGTLIHSNIENYLTQSEELIVDIQYLKPFLDKIKNSPGEVLVEQKLAIDRDGVACDYKSEDAYLRSISDCIIINDDTKSIRVIDWKTGKQRNYAYQADAIVKCLRGIPKYKDYNIKVLFYFVDLNLHDVYEYKDIDTILNKIDVCIQEDNFEPTPSGLCLGWCPVKTCKFNGHYGLD